MELLLRFAHLTLDKIDNLLRLGHGAVLCDRAHDYVVLVEQNDRWRDPFALGIWNDLRFTVGIDVRHGRERRSEIDSDSFAMGHEREITKLVVAQRPACPGESAVFVISRS